MLVWPLVSNNHLQLGVWELYCKLTFLFLITAMTT